MRRLVDLALKPARLTTTTCTALLPQTRPVVLTSAEVRLSFLSFPSMLTDHEQRLATMATIVRKTRLTKHGAVLM